MSQSCYNCGFPVYYNTLYKKFMCEAGCDDDSVRIGQIRSYFVEYATPENEVKTMYLVNFKSKYDAEVDFFKRTVGCRILKMEELSKVYTWKIYRIHDNMAVGEYRSRKEETQEEILLQWLQWSGSNYPITQLKAVSVT